MGSIIESSKIGESSKNLDKLIAESEETLKRLEVLDKSKTIPWGQRISNHLKKNSNNFVNIALAGSVFIVAVTRLNEKYAHQAEKEAFDEKVKALSTQNTSLLHHLSSVHHFVNRVESAAIAGGRQLAPQLQGALNDFRQSREAIKHIIESSSDVLE